MFEKDFSCNPVSLVYFRYLHGFTAENGKLFVFGGFDASGTDRILLIELYCEINN